MCAKEEFGLGNFMKKKNVNARIRAKWAPTGKR